jgi:hypothetical protein
MSSHPGFVAGQSAFDFAPEDWQTAAWRGLAALIAKGEDFTTDDLLPYLAEISGGVELRALGGLMRQAQTRGWVKPLGYVESARKESHRRPKRQWRPVLLSWEGHW